MKRLLNIPGVLLVLVYVVLWFGAASLGLSRGCR
jgi:hypothetical protein